MAQLGFNADQSQNELTLGEYPPILKNIPAKLSLPLLLSLTLKVVTLHFFLP